MQDHMFGYVGPTMLSAHNEGSVISHNTIGSRSIQFFSRVLIKVWLHTTSCIAGLILPYNKTTLPLSEMYPALDFLAPNLPLLDVDLCSLTPHCKLSVVPRDASQRQSLSIFNQRLSAA